MRIATPHSFSFLRTVFSHGWFDLPPFHWDEEKRTLRRVLSAAPGQALLAEIRDDARGRLVVRIHAPARSAALRQVRHMLRLDEEFDEFHALCREIDGFAWAAKSGAGRLLRAPDPFEDLVKMICTTNCTWALTRVMVRALVEGLGDSVVGYRSFPSPEAMAKAPSRFYEREARAGYRAGYLRSLAERAASGEIRPARWLDPAMPAADLRREILSVKGAGRYVADNMLKLLGRYEGLGLDTWCRRKFAEIHHRGRRVSDRTIERFCAPFGRWRGLALWCDLTRDWFDERGAPRLPMDQR